MTRRTLLGLAGPALVVALAWSGRQPARADDTCEACHTDVAKAFPATGHGRAFAVGARHAGAGCTACHTTAAEHANSGEVTAGLTFAGASAADANATCLNCHTGQAAYWRGGTHHREGVRCTDCHKAHTGAAKVAHDHRQVTDTCLGCHTSQKKSLFQRSSHPLRDGQMSCASCHDPHGSPAEAAVASLHVNDKCYECHAEMRGPFLWDHIPVRENCMTCHDPHGSNQRNLLAQSAPRLCQSCHLFGHHQTVPGTPAQVWNQNNSCVNCHARIHGSNHPSGILFMR